MCQLCDEANLYMAQLEAAAKKAEARGKDDKRDKAALERDEAAAEARS
ncbi:MAG: hypothetical protein Q8L54_11135 [Devosia sp.]|nr:hypothetical protein [Devosia sp.]